MSLVNVETEEQQLSTALYNPFSTSSLLLPWCKIEDPFCGFLAAGTSRDSGEWFTHCHWMVKEMLLRLCKMALDRWWKILPYIHMYIHMDTRFKTTRKYTYI